MERRSLLAGAVASAIPLSASHFSFGSQGSGETGFSGVIPAPRALDLDGDGSVILDSTARIEAAPGTERVESWLRDGLTLFAGTTLANPANVGTHITLRIDPDTKVDHVTSGVSPDGESHRDEGYVLTVSAEGVDIVGMSAEAVFRGATTLVQLVAHDPKISFGTISDAPRFAWRGLSFDTVRTFHSVETVKKVLDLLALYKFNVFHFHLTDSEGWRFQVDDWPLLTEISGQTARGDRNGGYYTTEEFAEIVQYAADRFIRVVPEFDSPGHTASVINAYPELASDEIRAMDPAMQYLHPHQDGVPDLLRDVYSAMADQTNAGYIHIGGDEAIAMDQDLFHEYIQLAVSTAHETGKGVVAWQEAARGGVRQGDLLQWWIPDEMVASVQAAKEAGEGWGGWAPGDPVGDAFLELFSVADEDVPLALDQGANVILSSAKWMYLDTRYTEESADPSQVDQRQRLGIPAGVYYNGSVEDSYNWNPETVNADLPLDRIAGVEAAIWCESIEDESDLFFQLLPRLCGVAEKGWSDQHEWDDYRDRLALQTLFWDKMGLTWFKSNVVW